MEVNMVKGTRLLVGDEALEYANACEKLREIARTFGYQEVVMPSLWQQRTFVDKAGDDILGKMYTFKDKGDRDICLIPEVTAVIQEAFKADWNNYMPKPIRVFYIARCWRYDNPQNLRFREFTQFGVEILGPKKPDYRNELVGLATTILKEFEVDFVYQPTVKRGLSYYVGEGFEFECPALGAQKQIVGGGEYDVGIGFALGIERLIGATKVKKDGA